MGKPKDIAWGQVDIDSKNDSVVWCKHVAKFFLTPPCSTVDVERLFATAGQIYTPERMSLLAPKVEKSLFLNQNMKHVETLQSTQDTNPF